MTELDTQASGGCAATLPPPTTVSYADRVDERRGRRSGQVDVKRCPTCDGLVLIDVRRMAVIRTGVQLSCPACSAPVPVRRSDLERSAPDTPLQVQHRRPWVARLLARRSA